MKQFVWDINIDSSETTSYKVNKLSFGDGYEQVFSVGINNRRKSWQCSKTDYKAVIDAIVAFLDSTRGLEPFLLTPVPNEPPLAVRLSSEVSRQKVGGNVWKVGFSVEQVY
ncbi:hypothetical protein A9308_00550 [Moraxella atlantae]|uniref:Phage tail protein n=1 Tax=Faucicola atlantae TaxID=34059 RepID=A0A1B8Q8Y6_9GAMM|nr:phage tail protein [Moraxella atlantae]OBX73733.1 hypothetical protein A9308_00550 [Moraxella atlantae]